MFNVQIKTGDNLAAIQHRESRIEHRVLILGIGNILLKDEGFGVHVAHELQKHNLPGNVEVVDGGTAGLDILLSQEGLYKLVVIDAIRDGNEPGTIYKTRLNVWHPQVQLGDGSTAIAKTFGFDAATQDEQSWISLHQLSLIDALVAAEKMNCLPEEIVVIGVEPAEISLGLELSEPVMQSIPKVIEQVLEEIQDVIHRE